MLDVGKRISAEVLALPYVQSIEQQVGRAELGEDTWGPHRSEFHVELKPDATVDQATAQAELREILANYPGIQSEVVTFLGDRISESLSGETAQVAVKVFGDDLDALDATRRQDRRGAGQDAGHRRSAVQAPERHADDRHSAAAARRWRPAGLKAQDVLDTVETAYAGATVGQTFQGTRTVDVVVLLPDAVRHRARRSSASS